MDRLVFSSILICSQMLHVASLCPLDRWTHCSYDRYQTCICFVLSLSCFCSEKMLRMLVPQHKLPNNAKASTQLLNKITNEYKSISPRFVNISVRFVSPSFIVYSPRLIAESTSTISIDLLESLRLRFDILLRNRIHE